MSESATIESIIRTVRDFEEKHGKPKTGVVMYRRDIDALEAHLKATGGLYPVAADPEGERAVPLLYGVPIYDWDAMDATQQWQAATRIMSGAWEPAGGLKALFERVTSPPSIPTHDFRTLPGLSSP